MNGRNVILLLLYVVTGIEGTTIEELSPERYEEKKTISDIRVNVDGKLRVVVEMQNNATDRFIKRMAYYGACEIVTQLRKGDSYDKLINVVVISLINEYEFNDVGLNEKIENYEMMYSNIRKHGAYPDEYRVYLKNYQKEEIDFTKYDRENILKIVVRLLYNENDEEFMKKVKKYIEGDANVHMERLESLVSQIQKLNTNEEEIDRLTREALKEREILERIDNGMERGRKEGLEEGRGEGITIGEANMLKKNIIQMASRGLQYEVIADYLGVDIKEVEKILSANVTN